MTPDKTANEEKQNYAAKLLQDTVLEEEMR